MDWKRIVYYVPSALRCSADLRGIIDIVLCQCSSCHSVLQVYTFSASFEPLLDPLCFSA